MGEKAGRKGNRSGLFGGSDRPLLLWRLVRLHIDNHALAPVVPAPTMQVGQAGAYVERARAGGGGGSRRVSDLELELKPIIGQPRNDRPANNTRGRVKRRTVYSPLRLALVYAWLQL